MILLVFRHISRLWQPRSPSCSDSSIATDSNLSENGLLVSVPSPNRASCICNGGPRKHLHTQAEVEQGSSTPWPSLCHFHNATKEGQNYILFVAKLFYVGSPAKVVADRDFEVTCINDYRQCCVVDGVTVFRFWVFVMTLHFAHIKVHQPLVAPFCKCVKSFWSRTVSADVWFSVFNRQSFANSLMDDDIMTYFAAVCWCTVETVRVSGQVHVGLQISPWLGQSSLHPEPQLVFSARAILLSMRDSADQSCKMITSGGVDGVALHPRLSRNLVTSRHSVARCWLFLLSPLPSESAESHISGQSRNRVRSWLVCCFFSGVSWWRSGWCSILLQVTLVRDTGL